ncbi:MAG: hypothetical protein JWM74_6046 [Myxococcaceae bacterium]|nr:hypothetical protein [Myxococcaceae bacterium]
MYRELGTVGTVSGVRSGPYAGKPRTLALDRVPKHVKERLARALSGKGTPQVISIDETVGPSRRSILTVLLPALMIAGGLVALVVVWNHFASASGIPRASAMAIAFAPSAIVLALGAVFFIVGLRPALPRGGRYLLPLDIVELDGVGGTLRVVPMGGVRRATIERARDDAGKEVTLVLVFEDGARFAFRMKDERAAEHAYKLLENAQLTLEALTHTTDLEVALDSDPFFALRSEPLWNDPVPAVARPARRVAERAMMVSGCVLLGTALGTAVAAAERAALDDAAFADAHDVRSLRAYSDYLAAGGTRHEAEARAACTVLLEMERDREERDRAAARAAAEPQAVDSNVAEHSLAAVAGLGNVPLAKLTPEQASARANAQAAAMARFEARAASKKAIGIMRAALVRASESGDPRLRVRFHRTVADTTPASDAGHAWFAGEGLARFERTTIAALRVILSETIPAGLLVITEDTPDAPANAPVITVDYRVDRHADQDVAFAFDARFVVPHADVEGLVFRLTMPKPDKPLTTLRDKSLYRLSADGDPTLVPSSALSARAFDRLYDELYGFLFVGNPKVPLAADLSSTFGRPL